MARLTLIYSILAAIGRPIVRIYVVRNVLFIKLLCFVIISVDYQLVTKVLTLVVNTASKLRQ